MALIAMAMKGMLMANQDMISKKFNAAQSRLVLQASDLSLESISTMVARAAIDIKPQFQRRERWSPQKQSALIESFLLNVPVPPVYLMEEDYGTYSVIDGKQRISAIYAFINDNLKLVDLSTFTDINGYQYSSLPDSLRNALDVRPYLRVITLLRQSDSNLKYEVFTRLNEGGEPLNPQELRNVAFRGPLNDLVYDLASNSFLRQQLKIKNDKSPAYAKMDDAEYVLRFFTLKEEWKSFGGVYRNSLDTYMRKNRNVSDAEIQRMSLIFQSAISTCELIWGKLAFKRYAGTGWRDQMLAGMYDSQMVAAAELSGKDRDRAIDKRRKIIDLTKVLFQSDTRFDDSVRRATNNAANVKYRVEQMIDILRNV